MHVLSAESSVFECLVCLFIGDHGVQKPIFRPEDEGIYALHEDPETNAVHINRLARAGNLFRIREADQRYLAVTLAEEEEGSFSVGQGKCARP